MLKRCGIWPYLHAAVEVRANDRARREFIHEVNYMCTILYVEPLSGTSTSRNSLKYRYSASSSAMFHVHFELL